MTNTFAYDEAKAAVAQDTIQNYWNELSWHNVLWHRDDPAQRIRDSEGNSRLGLAPTLASDDAAAGVAAQKIWQSGRPRPCAVLNTTDARSRNSCPRAWEPSFQPVFSRRCGTLFCVELE